MSLGDEALPALGSAVLGSAGRGRGHRECLGLEGGGELALLRAWQLLPCHTGLWPS